MLRAFVLAIFSLMLLSSSVMADKTFDAIKARGYLKCGVSGGVPGFSFTDSKGQWHGIDVDICKAVSSALFNNPNKVEYVPLSFQQRFTALQSGEIDLLCQNATWTLTRDASLGLVFAGVNYYDGQGFMVPKKLGVNRAQDLNGADICVVAGTTTEMNLADYFRTMKLKYKAIVFANIVDAISAFTSGRCQAYTNDRSALVAFRSNMTNPQDYTILPDTISKEPLGPVVRRGDDEWFTVVKWVMYGLIEADEKGVTSTNVDAMKKSQDPEIQRLLGVNGEMGKKMGLPNDWGYNMIKWVGNYDEIYERNIAPLGLARKNTANALWTQGGLMYAMPIR